MTQYLRKNPCALCNKDVILDTDKKTITCGCGTVQIRVPAKWLLDEEFMKLEP